MTRRPCTGCGLWRCEGECYLESEEPTISTQALADLIAKYGSQLTETEPKKRPDGRWEIAA